MIARIAAAASVALVLVLTGCAAAPSADPTAPAEVTPEPTPTYVQPASPVSTLALDCADLIDLPTVQSHIAADTLSISVDQDSTPGGIAERAYAQAGGLRCVWGGSGRTDGGYDVGLQVRVLTDAAADYQTSVASDAGPAVAWAQNAFGSSSKTYCYAASGYAQCYGDILVGSAWIDFLVSDADNATATGDPNAWGSSLLTPIVAAIAAAGPDRPRWVPPADAATGSQLCADASAGSAVVGSPVTVEAPSSTGVYNEDVGVRRAGLTTCRWTSAAGPLDLIDVTVLPGGSWVYPLMVAEPKEAGGGLLGAAEVVNVVGADGAMVAQGDRAWAALSVGGSLVELSDYDSYDFHDLLPLLPRLSAAVG